MRSSNAAESDRASPLQMLTTQRSHVLLVLSNAAHGSETEFLRWYQGAYRRAALDSSAVLSVQLYEQHEIDITQGKHPRLPFHFMAVHELSLDGAPQAEPLIGRIHDLHAQQDFARAPATWLFYALGEKIGRAPIERPALMTAAFANPIQGQEREFREWYVTRHVRHALNIPALVSGQCFERTQFQRPGALEANFSMIALYEQEGSPQEMLDSFSRIDLSKFDFPMLDTSHFAEWVYRPLC
jgi:hypothetical protein